jgi:hypothetical protein
MAKVKLVGIPGYALEPRAEIEPNAMFFYPSDSINPSEATIHVGDFYVTGHVLQDIDFSTITVNDSIVPTSSTILSSYPGFAGQVLETILPIRPFKLAGAFADGQLFSVSGEITIHGRRPGDVNGVDKLNIADVVYLVRYVFGGGSSPVPLRAGDMDCDDVVNVVDIIYIVNYIFLNGPHPCIDP